MNLKEIQDLIKFVAKSDVREVELEHKDFKINIKTKHSGAENSGSEQAMQQPQYLPQYIYSQPPQQPPAQGPSQQPQPVQQQPAAGQQQAAKTDEPAKKDAPATADENHKVIKAPMIGTFYRRPGPDKESFVKVGDSIKEGDTVCVIEAMKLFNEIEAEISGKIVKVLVEDATPVEYDQPLFLVEPQ